MRCFWRALFLGLVVQIPLLTWGQEPSELQSALDQLVASAQSERIAWQQAAWARMGCWEAVDMLTAIAQGSQMGPGEGWFGPSESRYGWDWLAGRFDADSSREITPDEWHSESGWFARLDRDGDGGLTPADFDWSERSEYMQAGAPSSAWFRLADRSSNGRISAEEWQNLFARAAGEKGYLTGDDLRRMFPLAQPRGRAREANPRSRGPDVGMLLAGLLSGELGSFLPGPRINDPAPDFSLATLDGQKTYRLSEFRNRPVVLIFGSFT